MINLYPEDSTPIQPISEDELSDQMVLQEIEALKKELADNVMVLGHHYQQNDIIQFADHTGDSLKLAQLAQKSDYPYIIFCGVHFMAETADMLTKPTQQVILPDLRAGCSMADMAEREQVERAWAFFERSTNEKIIPVTYINCSAALKAFVGEKGGAICTSSNAAKIISWALKEGKKLLFFPDQHLGRNTCSTMGISLEQMALYNPHYKNGGLTSEQVQNSKILLWYGHCSVHQGFTLEQVRHLRKTRPDTQILVHPECNFEVFSHADDAGSTAYIIDKVARAPKGSSFAIGTEINLVNRLAQKFADKEIFSLSPYQCLCTTMYRVRPRWLLASFRAIKENAPINVIKVDDETRTHAVIALDRMLQLS